MHSSQRSTVVAVVVTVLGVLVPVVIGVAFFDRPSVPAAVATDDGLGPNLPPEVRAEKLRAIEEGVPDSILTSDDAGWGPPPVDQVDGEQGSAALVEAVKEVAPSLLVQLCLVIQLPDLSPSSLDAAELALPDRVRAVYASSQVDGILELLRQGINSLRRNPDQVYNRDCRFELDKVIGVQIDAPSSAIVSLQGVLTTPARITSYSGPTATTPDGWEVVPSHIFNMALELEADGWRVLNMTETTLDGNSLVG